ncbi:MAG: response regulator [Deltaproteobacteria bacterium]|nr:response regulator [Deltaproteobacteria bacterium]
MSVNILIVEDEEKIASLLSDYLQNDGYKTTIISHGDKVVSFVKQSEPALILLDIMLPGKNGTDICLEIRQFSNVPIIMVTAKIDEIDRLLGLGIGADDYICKPFSPREVVARVKAVLRRVTPAFSDDKIIVGPITIFKQLHQVAYDGKYLDLTRIEFELITALAAHPGRVYSRSELLSGIQGYNCDGYDRSIDSHVKNLRKKLQIASSEKSIIETVYGVGYRLNIKVK